MRKVFLTVMLCVGCMIAISCGGPTPKDEVLSKMEELLEWYKNSSEKVLQAENRESMKSWAMAMAMDLATRQSEIEDLIEKAREEGCDLEEDKDFQKISEELENFDNEVNNKLMKELYGE